MPERRIFCIVEGDGEVESVRILLGLIDPGLQLVATPWRLPRNRMLTEDHLGRAVRRGATLLGSGGMLLLLADADDDLPCALAPKLLALVQSSWPGSGARVVLARREFEAWLLASLESMRGHRGIPLDAEPIDEPEAIRGAKERLGRLMGRRYLERTDQPGLTARIDVALARSRSPSFDKLLRDLARAD
jgi:hypothetical protein